MALNKQTAIVDVAGAINGLCYHDLRAIGEALFDMCKEGNGARDFPKTAVEFSDMLCDWANVID